MQRSHIVRIWEINLGEIVIYLPDTSMFLLISTD